MAFLPACRAPRCVWPSALKRPERSTSRRPLQERPLIDRLFGAVLAGPACDGYIETGDVLPEKPWLVCYMTIIINRVGCVRLRSETCRYLISCIMC